MSGIARADSCGLFRAGVKNRAMLPLSIASHIVRLPTDEFRQSFTLLGTRRFGTFWIASLLSSIGTSAQQVACFSRR